MEATVEQKPATKPTIRQVRVRAKLQIRELAREADVDEKTIYRMERGISVTEPFAWKVVDALARINKTTYTLEDFDGLQVK